jgi:hypothetical protein
VLLAAIGRDDVDLPDVEIGRRPLGWSAWGVHEQLADLGYARREMIYGARETTDKGLPLVNVSLRDQKLATGGVLLWHLLWLGRIPREQASEVLQKLDAPAPGEPAGGS